MSARIRYTNGRGNTIPYPPLFDEIRQNYGFIDTRRRPDRVAEIPEARKSSALAALLTRLAQPDALLVSLGCDLGRHTEPKARGGNWEVAGGYVQMIGGRVKDHELDFLRSVAKAIENGLKIAAGKDRWEADLMLAEVDFKLDVGMLTESLWVWFFAKASTSELAVGSRDRLLQVIDWSIETLAAERQGMELSSASCRCPDAHGPLPNAR